MLSNKKSVKRSVNIIPALLLTSCGYLGPQSVRFDRADYNDAIKTTTEQQDLLNIIRHHDNERSVSLSVSQVNAEISGTAGISGTAIGIGGLSALTAAGPEVATGASGALSSRVVSSLTGSVNPSFSSQKNDTVSYIQETPSEMKSRLLTPISVESIAILPNSGWHLSPILTMTVNSLTWQLNNPYLVVNIISELYNEGYITITAGISDDSAATHTQNLPINGLDKPSPNMLVIHFTPLQKYEPTKNYDTAIKLWAKLLNIYNDTQPYSEKQERAIKAIVGLGINKDQIEKYEKNLPIKISLRTTELKNLCLRFEKDACTKSAITGAPLLTISSADGMVRLATDKASPSIEFVSLAQYKAIRSEAWNNPKNFIPEFYTISYKDRNVEDRQYDNLKENEEKNRKNEFLNCYLDQLGNLYENSKKLISPFLINSGIEQSCKSKLYPNENEPKESAADIENNENNIMGQARRYILIITTNEPPWEIKDGENPFISVEKNGKWYSISNNDEISKKNFEMISDIGLISSVPQQTQAPTSAIIVGGGVR